MIWVRHSGGPPFRGIIVIITLTWMSLEEITYKNPAVTEIAAQCCSGVAGPLADRCGGQICRPVVLAFGKCIACLSLAY